MTSPLPKFLVRSALALAYFAAGVLHLAHPEPFLGITPAWVPWPSAVVALTGVAELAGALALAQPWLPALRRAGGAGLALYALCVWPANFNHMVIDLARTDGGGLPLAYHIPRLLFQPVLIWAAWWASRPK